MLVRLGCWRKGNLRYSHRCLSCPWESHGSGTGAGDRAKLMSVTDCQQPSSERQPAHQSSCSKLPLHRTVVSHGCATAIGDPPLSRRQSLRKRRAVILHPLFNTKHKTRQAVRFPSHSQSSSRLASTVDHGPLNPKPPCKYQFRTPDKATLSGLP